MQNRAWDRVSYPPHGSCTNGASGDIVGHEGTADVGRSSAACDSLRPKKPILHHTDIAKGTAHCLSYSISPSLALLEEQYDLALLGRCSTCHRIKPLVKVCSSATLHRSQPQLGYEGMHDLDEDSVTWTNIDEVQ